jgi:hypothetical protein
MEPANPVIEPCAKGREYRMRDPKERLDFMRRQLDPEHQTGAGRIQEKIFPKPLVREQSAEGPLHVPLTHYILLCVLCRHGRVRQRQTGRCAVLAPALAHLRVHFSNESTAGHEQHKTCQLANLAENAHKGEARMSAPARSSATVHIRVW